jgi:hypothetical protein
MLDRIKISMTSMGDGVLQIQMLQDAVFTKNPEMAQRTLS